MGWIAIRVTVRVRIRLVVGVQVDYPDCFWLKACGRP